MVSVRCAPSQATLCHDNPRQPPVCAVRCIRASRRCHRESLHRLCNRVFVGVAGQRRIASRNGRAKRSTLSKTDREPAYPGRNPGQTDTFLVCDKLLLMLVGRLYENDDCIRDRDDFRRFLQPADGRTAAMTTP